MAKEKINVGVIGCGNISIVYFTNLTQHYKNVQVVACADMFPEKAKEAAEKYGVPKACSVDELLADPNVDLVVNLTIPAAHYEINRRALEAGKHVYCEKPLALSLEDADDLVKLADSKGLYVTSAPDTFLGAGLQTCRSLIDEGKLGKIVGFTANLVGHGSELWHPGPQFLYQKGAGPMLDMGPYYITALVTLLGPIKQLSCYCRLPEKQREIQGKMFDVEIDTSYTAIAEFENGAVGTLCMSFDIWQSQLPCLEIYGTNGALYGPDPNFFKGPVHLYDGKGLETYIKTQCHSIGERLGAMHGPKSKDFLSEVPLRFPTDLSERANMRGLGVSDIASALLHGRKPRLSGELSRHVVEALTAFKISSDSNSPYVMKTSCQRPEPVPTGLDLWQVD